jgi:hypothetical protein
VLITRRIRSKNISMKHFNLSPQAHAAANYKKEFQTNPIFS